jgi:3',5'-nucleoside bisphosphate phosphatase
LKKFECDLHIHSTLSACGSLDMSPRNIVAKAGEAGLNIIAITDHNMVENGRYAFELGCRKGLLVLFGMELQTREEIHLLILFGSYEVALGFQHEMYRLLPDVANDIDYFGDQVVVDEEDNIVRNENRLLLNSVEISLDDAVLRVKALGGLVIPSHIDRSTYSIISQLGYVPDTLPFDALEIVDRDHLRDLLPFIPATYIPLVSFSDAHYLEDIGKRRTMLQLEEATFAEVAAALGRLRTDAPQGVPGIPNR